MNSPTTIDISNIPELIRMVEKVNKTKEPLSLKKDDETMAVLIPADKARGKLPKFPKKTKADFEAMMSSAGSWKDVDTNRLLKDIYAERRKNNKRPQIKL